MANKAVEIRKLSYAYPDGTKALQDMNLDMDEGESMAVIGPNGAGKTTFLLHLNGLLNGEGAISIFGLNMEKKNLREIRKNVGLVFQDPEDQLFMPTVFEDVAFGPINMGLEAGLVKKRVQRALEKVNMLDKANCLSHHLSSGEQKRVAIATVLSMEPRMLVLDEPSSNLDHKHRRGLMQLLKNLELTKIMATHDLGLALETCSRVVLLDKGEIVSDGKILDILSSKDLLESHGLEMPPQLHRLPNNTCNLKIL